MASTYKHLINKPQNREQFGGARDIRERETIADSCLKPNRQFGKSLNAARLTMSWKEGLRASITPKTLVTSVVIALASYLAWKAQQKLAAWPSDELPAPIQEEGYGTAQENDDLVGELTRALRTYFFFFHRGGLGVSLPRRKREL